MRIFTTAMMVGLAGCQASVTPVTDQNTKTKTPATITSAEPINDDKVNSQKAIAETDSSRTVSNEPPNTDSDGGLKPLGVAASPLAPQKKTAIPIGTVTEPAGAPGSVDPAKVLVVPPEHFHQLYMLPQYEEAGTQGRVLEMTGVVGLILASKIQGVHVTLVGPTPEIAKFKLRNPRPWGKIAPGQEVTLRGFYRSPAWGWEFEIFKTGKSPLQTVGVDELIDAYAKSESDARDRYGKGAILTGTVASKTTDDDRNLRMVLAGDGDTKIECVFLEDDPTAIPDLTSVNVGDKIRVVASNVNNIERFSAVPCHLLPK